MTFLRVLAAFAAIGVVATGCGGPEGNRTPILETSVPPGVEVSSAPVGPRSAPVSPGAPLRTGDGFAEGTQPSQGPLVFVQVIDWVGSDQVSESNATFHLTEHCAYLQGPPAEPILLIWPKGQAWVDPAVPSTMHFREGSGEVRHLTDGQTVNLGGYSIGGDGYQYDPRPHESCPSNGYHLAVQEVR